MTANYQTPNQSANGRYAGFVSRRRLSAVLAALAIAPAGLGFGAMGSARASEPGNVDRTAPVQAERYGPRNLIMHRTNRPDDAPVRVRDRDESPVDAIIRVDPQVQERRDRDRQAERQLQEREQQQRAEQQRQEREQQRQADRERQQRQDGTRNASETPQQPSDRAATGVQTPPAANTSRILYVSASGGSDTSVGTQQAPLRTIAHALDLARPGDTVQLAVGTYSRETGEQFPLVIPAGVTLQGDDASEGKTVTVAGGGNFLSRTFAGQNVAIAVTNPNAIVSGITVTNPNTRGTGLWIEGADPTIKFSAFKGSHRDGIFVTGNSNPTVHNCTFVENGGNGMSLTRSSGGEIRDNWFQATGFGLAIGGAAAPLLLNNHIVNNNDGIVISDSATPILRGNIIENNRRDGIVAILRSNPDLGTSINPGNNRLSNNGRYNLNNATGGIFSAIGNNLVGGRISGQAQTR